MKSDEFIREVNEELQQDKLKALWTQYAALIVGAVILLVGGTAGIVGWQSYSASQLQSQGEIRAAAEEAFSADDFSTAIEDYAQLGSDFGAGPATIAAFGEAAALEAQGDQAAAAERLALAGAMSDADPALKALAQLRSIQLRLDEDEPDALIAELEPLAMSGSPFSLSAREALAIIAIRADDLDLAKSTLLSIIDDAFTSDGLQARATELFAAIGGQLPEAGNVADDAESQGAAQ